MSRTLASRPKKVESHNGFYGGGDACPECGFIDGEPPDGHEIEWNDVEVSIYDVGTDLGPEGNRVTRERCGTCGSVVREGYTIIWQ
jgi:hypothetical protein